MTVKVMEVSSKNRDATTYHVQLRYGGFQTTVVVKQVSFAWDSLCLKLISRGTQINPLIHRRNV